MIRRRSVVAGICSFVAAPSAVSMVLSVPTCGDSCIDGNLPGVDPPADTSASHVVFQIQGWDQVDRVATDRAGQHVATIHLTRSWRSAWL
jgi:hypothetical protein